MRFRKSVKIAKGVKLNASKSGVSATVGIIKGLSLNVGKNGIYVNGSIPGTGLYDRKKLVSFDGLKDKISDKFGKGKKNKPEEQEEKQQKNAGRVALDSKTTVQPLPEFELNLTEDGEVVVVDTAGNEITDASILRRIKAEDEYKEECAALMDQLKAALDSETDAFVNIARSAETVRPDSEYDADRIITPEYIEGVIEGWLSNLELPVEFSVDYDYQADTQCLMLDIDLPEIEDVPAEKAYELASGAVKSKEKSLKEIRADYVQCVFGLAVFFACHFFNVSPHIAEICASGYTQRRNDRTGDLQDEYVFSVRFDRDRFVGVDFQTVDPLKFCMDFTNRCNIQATGEMKTIEPYTAD